MKPFFLRFFFFSTLTALQISLANTVFSFFPVFPPLLLSAIVSRALQRGFASSWVWAIVAGVFLDAVSFGRIGFSSAQFICATAIFGFAAKRFLFGFDIGRLIFFGMAVFAFSLVFGIFEKEIFSGSFWFFSDFFFLFSIFSWSKFSWSLGVSVFTFVILFRITEVFDRYVDLFDRLNFGKR